MSMTTAISTVSLGAHRLPALKPAPFTTVAAVPAAPAGQVRLTGALVRRAEIRITSGRDPHALVMLQITTGAGMPVWAQHDMGAGFSMHLAAHSKSALLQAGDTVTVVCDGLMPRSAVGDPGLVALRVRDVIPHRQARPVTT